MKLDKMKIEPIRNHIIFEFVEDTTGSKFNETTESGILIVQDKDKQLEDSRQIRLLAVGPDVKGLKAKDAAIVRNLRWTNAFLVDDKKYWLTTEDEILATLAQPEPAVA